MSNVSIVIKDKKKSLFETVKHSIDLIGGIENYIKTGDSVLIKPNVLAAKKADTGATTSPEVIESIVRLCYEAGASKVTIAESSNWGIDTMQAFEYCGFAEVAKRTGAVLFDLKKDNYVIKNVNGYVHNRINLPEILLTSDKVINVPVLKVHTMTKVSLSLKNISVGVSNDDDKQKKLHRIGLFSSFPKYLKKNGSFLEHAIADINMAVRSDLIIIDGLIGLQGLGAPLFGRPAYSNVLLAGDNRVSVDAVGSILLGYSPTEIAHINLAYRRGLGDCNINNINIFGERLYDIKLNFEKAYDINLKDIPSNFEIVNNSGKCTTCLATLNYVLKRHKKVLESLNTKVTVFVGENVKYKKLRKDRRLLVYYGNCAGEIIYGGGFVPGCPPRSRRQFFQAIGALDLYEEDEGLVTSR
ncbi:MAG: hypothetical protein PWQ60_186 [Thermoanaerobacteraceae bacterium]|nr:hypothetical protein [Thermoanaerobacteraceae bacterium]